MSNTRVLVFGSWDRGDGYPRATALLDGLRQMGAEVTECYAEVPYAGPEKRRLLKSPWLWPSYWWSMLKTRKQAMRQLEQAIALQAPDLVLVPYPGHFAVHWAKKVWSGPIVLDLFLSAYDTAVVDRKVFRPGSMMASALRHLDRRAAQAAHGVLLDTAQNADYAAALTGLPRTRFHVVPVSDPGEPSTSLSYRRPVAGKDLEILFFGTGVPLHGLSYLLDALDCCERVRLTLVGGSQEDRQRAAAMPSSKVRVMDSFVPTDELRDLITRSHLVAGVFGRSEKAMRVIPFKVMMALALGRPVITGHTPAIASLLTDGVECITVPVGDGPALGSALQSLADDPSHLALLASAAREAYEREFSLQRVGQLTLSVCHEVCGHTEDDRPVISSPPIENLEVLTGSIG